MIDVPRFDIHIFRLDEEDCWTLEVINDERDSYVWDDVFAAEQAALEAIGKEGATRVRSA